jgi:hypothetical protein
VHIRSVTHLFLTPSSLLLLLVMGTVVCVLFRSFPTIGAINRFSIEYIGVKCMLRALVFSFMSSDGGLVIDEREKRSICIKQALYSRTQTK